MTKSSRSTRKKKMITLSLHEENLKETSYKGYQRITVPKSEALCMNKKTGKRSNRKAILFPQCIEGESTIEWLIVHFGIDDIRGSRLNRTLIIKPGIQPIFPVGGLNMDKGVG